MKYQVMKPIPTSSTTQLTKGVIVEVEAWPVRNVLSLVRNGYLQEVLVDPQVTTPSVTTESPQPPAPSPQPPPPPPVRNPVRQGARQ